MDVERKEVLRCRDLKTHKCWGGVRREGGRLQMGDGGKWRGYSTRPICERQRVRSRVQAKKLALGVSGRGEGKQNHSGIGQLGGGGERRLGRIWMEQLRGL